MFSWINDMTHLSESILYYFNCHSSKHPLTYLPLDKMAAIFTDDILKCIFMNVKSCITNRNPKKFIPKGSMDNNSALVQVMAWCRTGTKPLPEPRLTQFTNAYMQY